MFFYTVNDFNFPSYVVCVRGQAVGLIWRALEKHACRSTRLQPVSLLPTITCAMTQIQMLKLFMRVFISYRSVRQSHKCLQPLAADTITTHGHHANANVSGLNTRVVDPPNLFRSHKYVNALLSATPRRNCGGSNYAVWRQGRRGNQTPGTSTAAAIPNEPLKELNM